MHSPSSWFAEWFNNPLYTSLYSHRSDEEAERVVRLLTKSVPLTKGARVLDLCCGGGRHTKALIETGFEVVGIDLSETLLGLAREETEGLPVRLYQGDMRSPYPHAPFDCIANFFTSFGYFDDARDDEIVIEQIVNALKPHGYFFLDFFNADYVRENLVEADILDFEDWNITQKRSIEAGFVVKHITVSKPSETASGRTFVERVRLYSKSDLEDLLIRYGMSIGAVYGNYDGKPFHPSLPRCIIVAQKRSF